MFRVFVAALVGLSLASAAQAQDASSRALLGQFQNLCDAGQGDGARALAMVQEAGWAQIPPQVFANPESPFEETTAYMNAEEGNRATILIVASMSDQLEGVPVTIPVCVVMLLDMSGGQLADVSPLVDDWLALPPLDVFGREGRRDIYGFVWRDGVRVGVTSEAAALQAMLNGELHLIAGETDENSSIILYMRPRTSWR